MESPKENLPSTRAEAKRLGSKYYFTGKPCKRGHVDVRGTGGGTCSTCQRENARRWNRENPERNREKARKWSRENPEKACEITRRWYRENSEKAREAVRKWERKNPEKVREYDRRRNRRRMRENPEKVREAVRIWKRQNREKDRECSRNWRWKNPERARELNREWRQEHRPKRNESEATRRSVKLQRTPPWADRDLILVVYAEAERLTAETGIEHHVDHIYPLQGDTVCGLHIASNLQVISQRENNNKWNRHPDEFYGRDRLKVITIF